MEMNNKLSVFNANFLNPSYSNSQIMDFDWDSFMDELFIKKKDEEEDYCWIARDKSGGNSSIYN